MTTTAASLTKLPSLRQRSRIRRTALLGPHTHRIVNWAGASLVLVVTLIALLAPVIAPHDPLVPIGIPFQKPGAHGFLLGSDSIGRDILSRTLYGVRASWFAALAVVVIGMLFGGLIGLIAGASGGWVDNILMRITDAFLSL
ncbi:MAG: transporter permease, partial [Frankiales bacterium]|nr:transporter permease [Frankiales bacterium]